MAYNITSYDGNFTVDAMTIDTANTALALPGKNFRDWGQPYTNNFTHLLENFAGDAEQTKKRTGQLWYDTATRKLKVWDSRDGGTWKAFGGETATKLTNAVTIALAGEATGSVSFDGSQNATITVSLTPIPGLVPGQYTSPAITIDTKGRIVSINNNGGDGVGPSQYVSGFNGRGMDVTLTSADVTTALGFTPYNSTNPSSYVTTGQVAAALAAAAYLPTGGGTMNGNINLNNKRITGVPTNPGDNTDAVNKAYVDQRIAGIGTYTPPGVTVSPYAPSGGNNGDVWYRY